jgi:hypothetical protein
LLLAFKAGMTALGAIRSVNDMGPFRYLRRCEIERVDEGGGP